MIAHRLLLSNQVYSLGENGPLLRALFYNFLSLAMCRALIDWTTRVQ